MLFRSAGQEASPRGTLLRLVGATGQTHWRAIGAISEDDWTQLLAQWQVSGAAPTPTLRSQGGLLGRACRIAAGSQLRLADVRAREAEDRRIRLDAASGSAPSSTRTSLDDTPRKKKGKPAFREPQIRLGGMILLS